ncbi:MAG: Fic family protein [Actinomycetaceae bacterium]|nr:Fic family protein [Actinomycetaceae bacterium]
MLPNPGYGETPLPFEELDALLPEARASLAEPITKAAIYDLEQAVEEALTEELLTAIFNGDLELPTLLTDYFLRELHRKLYGGIWTWAGQYRHHLSNIGIDWPLIPGEVRGAIETLRYRWLNTNDWTPQELGIAAHAELVRIHPFIDGNGRSTRLFANLVFVAAQDSEEIKLYDWRIDKHRYIELLHAYDQHRNPDDLVSFIPTFML